jgi:hypothetical protein
MFYVGHFSWEGIKHYVLEPSCSPLLSKPSKSTASDKTRRGFATGDSGATWGSSSPLLPEPLCAAATSTVAPTNRF